MFPDEANVSLFVTMLLTVSWKLSGQRTLGKATVIVLALCSAWFFHLVRFKIGRFGVSCRMCKRAD